MAETRAAVETRVGNRYAAALFAFAKRQGEAEIDRVQTDLSAVSAAFHNETRLRAFLLSPLIPAEKKRQVVEAALADRVSQSTLHFLYLLIDKHREAVLDEVDDEFRRLYDQDRGIVRGQAASAVPLTGGEVETLAARLSAQTGKQVLLTNTIDPELLGGVVVQLGDRVLDGSVRGYLRALEEALLAELR